MRIEVALEKYLLQLRADGRSLHTVDQAQRHVRLLARWAHDARPRCDRVAKIGHEGLAAFLASDVANGSARGGEKKASSTNCLRSSLKGFFSYLHRSGHLALDPSRLVRRARCSPPPPRGISEEDQHRLLNTLRAAEGAGARRDEAIVRLMLSTGVRLGSAVALDLEDVDIDRREIRLRKTKGDAPDTVYLNQAIARHLRRYMRGRRPGALFTGVHGKRLSRRHIQRRFESWVKKAGINARVSPHSMRHAFAMRLYSRTHDILLVKEALTHRAVSSAMVYARPNLERIRRAL